MNDVVAAEWRKLWAIRSTVHVLGVVVVFLGLCVLWAWYVRGYWDGESAERRASLRTAAADQPLLLVLPVCAAVLGALSITSEYGTGMIRTSLAAVPRRRNLFAAKAAVASGVMLVAALVSAAAAVLAGRAVVGGRAVPAFHAPLSDQAPHLLSVGIFAAASALMALGLGAVLRSTAATITAVLVGMLVVPNMMNVIPAPWGERLWSFMPASLPEQIATTPGTRPDVGVLSPVAASALLVLYVASALGAGAFCITRRDA